MQKHTELTQMDDRADHSTEATRDAEGMENGNLSLHRGTLVITRRVPTDRTEEYKVWLRKIGEAVAEIPGFLHRTVYPPGAESITPDFWTHVIHFDSDDAVAAWSRSDKCKALLEEVESLTEDTSLAVLHHGHGDLWGMVPASEADENSVKFASQKAAAPPTPLVFRQTLVVLFNLFPCVMFNGFWLEYVWGTSKIPGPVRMLVGVVFTVPMLTYFGVPTSMKAGFAPWVFDQGDFKDANGGISKKALTYTAGIILYLVALCAIVSTFWPNPGYAGDGLFGGD